MSAWPLCGGVCVSEGLGKRVVLYLDAGDVVVLVGGDRHEGSEGQGDVLVGAGRTSSSRIDVVPRHDDTANVLVHGMQKKLK